MSALSAIPGTVADRLSPVMVKELRQAVRSGFVTAALVGLLLIQLGAITTFLLVGYRATPDLRAGQQLFITLQSILVIACMLFIPFYTAVRLAVERTSDHVDMMFITTMKPLSIVGGKLMTAAALALVFFAASTPFMFATYLMRGIDIPSMIVTLSLGLLLVIVAAAGAILLASILTSVQTRIMLGVLLAIGLVLAAATSVVLLGYMATSGIGDAMSTWSFWGQAAVVLLAAAEVVGLLLLLAAAALAPEPSNRMLPVRVFVTGAWFVTGLAAAVAAWVSSSWLVIGLWALLQMLVLFLALLIGICEREDWSVRIRRQIPWRAFRRVLVFPLFTGWANAIAWCVLMMGLTLFATVAGGVILPGVSGIALFSWAMFLGVLGMNAYAVSISALLIRKAFLAKRVKASMTWLMAMALALLVLVVPAAVAFLVGRLVSGSALGGLVGLGVLGVFIPVLSVFIGGPWMLLAMGLSMPWFIRRCRAFKHYRTDPPLPTALMLAGLRPAQVQV